MNINSSWIALMMKLSFILSFYRHFLVLQLLPLKSIQSQHSLQAIRSWWTHLSADRRRILTKRHYALKEQGLSVRYLSYWPIISSLRIYNQESRTRMHLVSWAINTTASLITTLSIYLGIPPVISISSRWKTQRGVGMRNKEAVGFMRV